MSKVATKKCSDKPNKPYPDFPLFPHATKRWAKKIRGKLHYFGPWQDAGAAVNRYLAEHDDLYAGRKPRVKTEGTTIRDLCNRFLTSKTHLRDTSEITPRTFSDYQRTCERIVRVFGKDRLVDDLGPDDFESLRADIAKTHGLVSLANEINRCRVVFKFAYDADLIERPLKYGATFKRPSKRALRIERTKKGARMFEASQVRKLLDAAPAQLRAMILLGVNCGFGNADVSRLPLCSVDLDGGWINYPRPKTGIDRRCPLWPETVHALREALAARPTPKSPEHSSLVFVTKYGASWHKDTHDNPIANELRKLLDDQDMYRPGLSFYALRHTFETIAGESRDQVAVDYIMGHARDDMASVYRERISDDRLIAVTKYVREWLVATLMARSSPRRIHVSNNLGEIVRDQLRQEVAQLRDDLDQVSIDIQWAIRQVRSAALEQQPTCNNPPEDVPSNHNMQPDCKEQTPEPVRSDSTATADPTRGTRQSSLWRSDD